jgi:predicted kinase
MSEVVIINGPPGVGKTTVCDVLVDLLPGTVCIRGDHLRAFAPTNARDHLGGGSTYRAAAALAQAYLAMGAARIVFDYVFLRPSHVAYFREGFSPPKVPHYMFTLWAPLDVVQARERQRVARSPLGAAVEECWNEMALHKDVLGELIDNTTMTPAEVARRVDASLRRVVAERAVRSL